MLRYGLFVCAAPIYAYHFLNIPMSSEKAEIILYANIKQVNVKSQLYFQNKPSCPFEWCNWAWQQVFSLCTWKQIQLYYRSCACIQPAFLGLDGIRLNLKLNFQENQIYQFSKHESKAKVLSGIFDGKITLLGGGLRTRTTVQAMGLLKFRTILPLKPQRFQRRKPTMSPSTSVSRIFQTTMKGSWASGRCVTRR